MFPFFVVCYDIWTVFEEEFSCFGFVVFRGSCVVLHVSSSVGVSCPMVSSPSREGSREEVPSFWCYLIYADLEGFSRRVVNCCDGQHFSYSA
jgi:hypothetical protein